MNQRAPKLLASLLLAALAAPTFVCAQGSLAPPGAPAPTMKTLEQIEPRTPISEATTITQSGSYYLTKSITVSGGNGITINADDVTLDLNGFTIHSTAPSATGYGIFFSGRRNISIANGYVNGGVTNNGSNVYSGSGFITGISGSSTRNVKIAHVSVQQCLNSGIFAPEDTAIIEACSVRTVGLYGIWGGTITASVAEDCGGYGIGGDQVSDCRGVSTGSSGIRALTVNNSLGSGLQRGIEASTVNNSYGHASNNSGSAYGIIATTAVNNSSGSGFSFTSSAYGISGRTVNGCYGAGYGYSASDAFGIFSSGSVQNSYGFCTGSATGPGFGIEAETVSNCKGHNDRNYNNSYWGYAYSVGILANKVVENSSGYTATGVGIEAEIARGCHGENSGEGSGIWARKTALNCYGKSINTYYGYGISAGNVNACYGEGGWGIYAEGTVDGSRGIGSAATGIQGVSVQNSHGSTTNGTYGVYAHTALNSKGESYNQAGSYGLYAKNAQNCFGSTTAGSYGLYATTAVNCRGESDSMSTSSGLRAENAQNCYGYTQNGTYGLSAITAIGCRGKNDSSRSGTYGIYGTLLNSCSGSNGSGTAVGSAYKYNMP